MNGSAVQSRESRQWELTEPELEAFFASLDEEFATMALSLEQMKSADLLVAARRDGRVCGVAGIRTVHRLPVAFFVVNKARQGLGLGRELVGRLHERAKRAGYWFICLSVIKENSRALGLYRKNGYRVFFARKGSLYMIRLLGGW